MYNYTALGVRLWFTVRTVEGEGDLLGSAGIRLRVAESASSGSARLCSAYHQGNGFVGRSVFEFGQAVLGQRMETVSLCELCRAVGKLC